MAIQSSGQIEISELAAEFGGSEPHALSEYYGGGGLVPSGANPNVPTSGELQMTDFYDSVAATVLTISSNTSNYNIKTAVASAGGDQSTPVILTVNSGVTVSSTSTSTPAMKTDTGWSNGVTINITNNGSIVGASGSNTSASPGSGGGSGGNGGSGLGQGNGTSGSAGSAGSGTADSANNGGDAFEHSQTGDNNLSVIFDTAGTRTGGAAGTKTITGNGGGGGGGGRSAWWQNAGGGGGGGAANGGGGSGRISGSSGGANSGGGGGAGAPGSPWGGSDCAGYNGHGGSGGSGGNLGSGGSSGGGGGPRSNNCHGGSGGYPGGSGGSAGSNGTASGQAGSALAGNTDQIS